MTRLLISSVAVFTLALGFTACTDSPGANDDAVTVVDGNDAVPEAEVVSTFGEPFAEEKVLPAVDVVVEYEESALLDTVLATVQGEVHEVCQKKGCWMTIAAGEEEDMMVRFKDYGFFMPKDISGREVVMHGKVFYQTTTVDELRHYAEDAGDSPEEIALITEPKKELHFLADGVRLLD